MKSFLVVLALATALGVQAQPYPSRPVRIITVSPAGSILDIAPRQLADKLGPALGQPVIVDNKPGAGGQLAMEAVAKSPPDGHVVGICNFVQLAVNPSMYDRLTYDPVKDFSPVILLYTAPLVLTVHPGVPASTLAELVALVKSQPGKVFYGSSGNGQPPHVLTELFKHLARIDVQHVPYKGAAASALAILAGEVAVNMESASAVIPHIKSGRLKALAITGDKRMATLPQTPTFGEAGVPGMSDSWVGIVAPAGTPAQIVARLNREFARALEAPELKAYYETAGRNIVASSPDALAALIRDEIPRWREVVKAAGIRPG
jgi:tripartite-type tricarboxylate transporter receptor subunit TctC